MRIFIFILIVFLALSSALAQIVDEEGRPQEGMEKVKISDGHEVIIPEGAKTKK